MVRFFPLLLLALLACGDAPTEPNAHAAAESTGRRRPARPIAGEYFTIRVVDEDFQIFATNSATIQLLRENFEGKNSMHPSGRIALGNAGLDHPWNFHYIPDQVGMSDFSIEVCDGKPSYVSENPEQYLQVGWCPWMAKVVKVGR